MEERVPTGTVTFLFTDVEGSTAMWESDPDMPQALARHDEILRAVIEDRGGYIFTTAGDSFAAAFSSAPAAVSAARAAQENLADEPWETAEPLRVRMAVHTGTAEERDGDYFGPALNRTARLLAVGHGGQVLLSESAASLVEEDLTDLGELRLKDLAAPQRVHQLGTTPFPPPRSLDAQPNNLPVQLTTFVGREDDVDEVKRLVGEHRLVTLTGIGGSGKTRLALQAAGDVIHEFPDGVWFVEFADITDSDLLSRAVLDAMGISMGGSVGTGARLESHLSDKQLLLVFDNCEHLLDPIAALAEGLLRAAPAVRVLATSREGFAIGGEWVWRVPSMDAASVDSEAVRLFVERASHVAPAFALTPESTRAVIAICKRLDGLPLAIELAAAQMRVLSVDAVSERLDDRFRLLTGGSRTAVERQRTLLATVEWSYDLLSEHERTLFERLGVFRGGFTLEAAEAIVGGDGLAEPDVLELLTNLVDKSLVVAADQRFRLLETLRQFGFDRLTDRGEGETMRRRHACYFLRLAEKTEPQLETSAQVEWTVRLNVEHDNMRSALRWLIDAGEVVDALRLVVALSVWFWYLRRDYEEAVVWHEETLALIDDTVSPELAAMSYAKASLQATRGGRFDRGDELALEAIRLGQEAGHVRAQIVGHWTLGHGAVQGRYDEGSGLAHFHDALRLAEEADDAIWVTRSLAWIMQSLDGLGRYLEAKEAAERAVAVAEDSGWVYGIGNVAMQAAFVSLSHGEFARAAELATRAVAVSRSLDDPWDLVHASHALAMAMRLNGDAQRSVDATGEAIALASRRTDRTLMARLHAELAAGYVALDRPGSATEAILDALRLVEPQFPYSCGLVLLRGAAILIARGDTARGITLMGTAERYFAETYFPSRYDLVEFEALLATAREELGAGAYGEALKAGGELDPRSALEQARAWLEASRD